MLNTQNILLILAAVYIVFLFFIAHILKNLYKKNNRYIENTYVYSLTLAVYCSTWTFYGAMGNAATVGIEYINIYIGPTLLIFTWWFLLRKIVRITKNNNVGSIAGLISFRYGKSKTIGILVTIICLFGIIPYMSLQLKAINESISIISTNFYHTPPNIFSNGGFTPALLIGIMAAVFYTKHAEEQKMKPELVGVVAFQAVFILLVMIMAGLYIAYGLFDGITDIFQQMSSHDNIFIREKFKNLTTMPSGSHAGSEWFALNLMSMFAIILLPRQFHMASVENFDETHIAKSMYLFPLYLFAITFFIIPVVGAGILSLNKNSFNDYIILNLVMDHNKFLTILIYLGGFAAGANMMLISSISLANMTMNNLIIPATVKFIVKKNRKFLIARLKRLIIYVIIFLSYLFYCLVGNAIDLLDLGRISFVAVSQFAPALFIGLYWKNGNAKGAAAGISVGFLVWIYTIIIPYLSKMGIISSFIIINGPFNIALLQPTHFMGLQVFGFWGNALFWSLLLNFLFYIFISNFTKTSDLESETANICINALEIEQIIEKTKTLLGLSLNDLQNILGNLFGENFAREKINQFIKDIDKNQQQLTETDLTLIQNKTEKTISEAAGPGASKLILDSYMKMRGTKGKEVIGVFQDLVSLGVGESKDTLLKRLSELNVMLNISSIFAEIGNLQLKIYNVLKLVKNTFNLNSVVLRQRDNSHITILSYAGEMKEGYITGFKRNIDNESYIGKTVIEKKPFAVNDIDTAKLNQYSIELKNSGVVSFCHIPLIINRETIGVLSLYNKLDKNIFTDQFLAIMQSVSNQIAFYIDIYKQTENLIKMREIEKELSIAKDIQKILLPIRYPHMPGLNISAICLPSEFVGGDYYDFFVTGDQIVDIVIADVSGHNVASALIMSEGRTLIKSLIAADHHSPPGEIITLLNNEIFEDLEKLSFIITIFYMKIDMGKHEIIYSNAGHNCPVTLNQNGMEELPEGDILLGVLKDYKYPTYTHKFSMGDTFFLYTDGITEAENSYGKLFGKERLYNTLLKHRDTGAKGIQAHVLESILHFRGLKKQKDDITMVVINTTEES